MPLKDYGVLSGRLLEHQASKPRSNHIQLLIDASGTRYRVPINVKSQDGSEVEYVLIDQFEHPMLEGVLRLPQAFTKLPPQPSGVALDLIRANLARREDYQPLPDLKPGADNDLNDKIRLWLDRALRDKKALVYAFGERWIDSPNKPPKNKYFEPEPHTGVHDIHMNQGNPKLPKSKKDFSASNGIWQDGGLLLHLPGESRWVALFMKFQSQSWHTDDATGHPLDARPVTPAQPGRTRNVPDGVVRIISAIANPGVGNSESIVLLNTSPATINLEGWSLLNRQQEIMELSGSLESGQPISLEFPVPFLSNRGDTISLLDPNGIKVDGVSYTKAQARHRGWTITF
jgi:uncharacterized protein YukJ